MARADERLAHHYAQAFLTTLLEMGGEEAISRVEAQWKTLLTLFSEEAGAFFLSPVFDTEEKFSVLEKFVVEHSLDPALGRFVRLLISERSAGLLPRIAEAYSEVLREHRNEAQATVRSAFPLEGPERERLVRALKKATGKEILMQVEVDRSLIGGVVAEVGGTVFDASIRGYLKRLQEEFEA